MSVFPVREDLPFRPEHFEPTAVESTQIPERIYQRSHIREALGAACGGQYSDHRVRGNLTLFRVILPGEDPV